MKIALLQLNPIVGDVEGNARKIRNAFVQLSKADPSIDLFITSELALTGYPPKDLLLQPAFLDRCEIALSDLSERISNIDWDKYLIVGSVERNKTGKGKPLFNSAFVLSARGIVHTVRKSLLPNYDVFDESRYFEPFQYNTCFTARFQDQSYHTIGITICEDIWNGFGEDYGFDPVKTQLKQKPSVLVNLSASPFEEEKEKTRREIANQIVGNDVIFVYVNQVGGNDDLIFDGGSFVATPSGLQAYDQFKEGNFIFDTETDLAGNLSGLCPQSKYADIWKALVLGIKDYLQKNGFEKAVLGLSGGIDSALVAALAVDALGAENVLGITMPSEYSSDGSVGDSEQLAKNLGIKLRTVPIQRLVNTLDEVLEHTMDFNLEGLTEENAQPRLRGVILMAVSNELGYLLLTTGNKSEISVGYFTLYGDACGGLAVIYDIYKTDVYELAKWKNVSSGKEVIPQSTIDKEPSAELGPDQKDTDSLPPYPILDRILKDRIEQQWDADRIVKERNFDPAVVEKVLHLLKISEFKRQQLPPGLKISSQAFGTGWKMPISSTWSCAE